MKRILVPCDFSKPAIEAYKFAVDLAAASRGEVLVMHAIALPMLTETTFGIQPHPLDTMEFRKLERHSTEAFGRMKKSYPAPKDVQVKFLALEDYLLPGIHHMTEETGIDLIVMGTNGSAGMEEFFVGSNTEKVVRQSRVPVIALRQRPLLKGIKKIVLPTTLEPCQDAFMERVKALQAFFGASIHVLFLNPVTLFSSEREARDAMLEFASHYGLKDFTVNIRHHHSEATGIIDFVHETEGDLLAMGTHGRQGLARLFSGSVTEKVVNHVDCPIWTCNIRKNQKARLTPAIS